MSVPGAATISALCSKGFLASARTLESTKYIKDYGQPIFLEPSSLPELAEEVKLVPQEIIGSEELKEVPDQLPIQSSVLSITAEMRSDVPTIVSNIQDNVPGTYPSDNTSPEVPVTSLTATAMVPSTTTVPTPSSPSNKWNNMSPKIREPPPSYQNPKVHALHGFSRIRGHNSRDSRRLTRSYNNSGAYKVIQDPPDYFEPPLPSGLMSQVAQQLDDSTDSVLELVPRSADTGFDKDSPPPARLRAGHGSRK